MTTSSLTHAVVARWFYLILGTAVLYLFWNIISPYAIVLVTAAIAAVILSPVEQFLRKKLTYPKVSSLLTVLLVFVAIVGPLLIIGFLLGEQVNQVVSQTVANPAWRENFDLENFALIDQLPQVLQRQLMSYDPNQLLDAAGAWVQTHIGTVFSSSAAFVFKTFIFFICLFFFLLERERIYKEMLELSPLRDAVDRAIVSRMVETVRGVVFGALIVAVVQGIISGIGLAIFGVPAPLIWAALVIIAAQIPILGTGTIMVPAIVYLFVTGHPGSAVGLALWAMIAVGLVDNILSPYIVGTRTRMHALLILLSILGGLEFFGPIGFILGPTVLAAFLVVIQLYKAGILEKGMTPEPTRSS